MNTNDIKTIREALEEAVAIDKRDKYEVSMYTEQLSKAIAALDRMEAQQQPKRLTEKDLEGIARTIFPPDQTNEGYPWYSSRRSEEDIACKQTLRWLRDHGYLGGLTVDDVANIRAVIMELMGTGVTMPTTEQVIARLTAKAKGE